MSPYISLFYACLIGVTWASPIMFGDGMPVDTITLEINGDGEARISNPVSMQRSATGDTEEFYFDGTQSRGSEDGGPLQGFLMVKEGDEPMKVFPYGGSTDGRANVVEAQPIPEEYSGIFKIFNGPDSPFGQPASGFALGRNANSTDAQTETDDEASETPASDDTDPEASE